MLSQGLLGRLTFRYWIDQLGKYLRRTVHSQAGIGRAEVWDGHVSGGKSCAGVASDVGLGRAQDGQALSARCARLMTECGVWGIKEYGAGRAVATDCAPGVFARTGCMFAVL